MLKKKNKFGAKIALFGYFGLEFEKPIAIYEISTLKFIRNEFLTIVSFGIGSAF